MPQCVQGSKNKWKRFGLDFTKYVAFSLATFFQYRFLGFLKSFLLLLHAFRLFLLVFLLVFLLFLIVCVLQENMKEKLTYAITEGQGSFHLS